MRHSPLRLLLATTGIILGSLGSAAATPILGSPTGLAHPTQVITFDELGYLGSTYPGGVYSNPVTTQFAPFGVSFPAAPGFSHYGFYWSSEWEDPIDAGRQGFCPSGPLYAAHPTIGFSGGCLMTGPDAASRASFGRPVSGMAFATGAGALPIYTRSTSGQHGGGNSCNQSSLGFFRFPGSPHGRLSADQRRSQPKTQRS